MAGVAWTEMPKGGFSFELCKRYVSLSCKLSCYYKRDLLAYIGMKF